MRRIFPALALCLAMPLAAQDQPEPDHSAYDAEDWRAAARRDILFTYDQFVRNHPGIYDLANPGFPDQLARARAKGLEAASKASDLAGYSRALAEFSAVLQDGHAIAGVLKSAGKESAPVWPGFLAVWRGDGLFVRTQDDQDPLYGARFVSCDGQAIEPFLRDRLTTRYFRPDEAGQWWVRPTQLFYAHSGLSDDQPRACTFSLADGTQQRVSLSWRALTDTEEDWRRLGVYGDQEATALSEKRDGIFFIGLQDFQPDADEIAAFERLYVQTRDKREELKGARALVLDLRRNNGGSSTWSRRLAKILWGKEAVDARTGFSGEVLWRTSAANSAHVASIADKIRAQGDPESAEYYDRLATAMRGAADRGEALFAQGDLSQEEDEAPDETSPDPSPETDFETPVYVIVKGGCASACLDALDYFTAFENVKLIGAPSSADSTYMEVRVVDLPAGPGSVVIPTKVYVGRTRGWGETYAADIEMTDLDWSTDTFLDWIERDLAEGES